jgi:hypothetical protein
MEAANLQIPQLLKLKLLLNTVGLPLPRTVRRLATTIGQASSFGDAFLRAIKRALGLYGENRNFQGPTNAGPHGVFALRSGRSLSSTYQDNGQYQPFVFLTEVNLALNRRIARSDQTVG